MEYMWSRYLENQVYSGIFLVIDALKSQHMKGHVSTDHGQSVKKTDNETSL